MKFQLAINMERMPRDIVHVNARIPALHVDC